MNLSKQCATPLLPAQEGLVKMCSSTANPEQTHAKTEGYAKTIPTAIPVFAHLYVHPSVLTVFSSSKVSKIQQYPSLKQEININLTSFPSH